MDKVIREQKKGESLVDALRGRTFHTEDRPSAEGPEQGRSPRKRNRKEARVTGAQPEKGLAGNEFTGEQEVLVCHCEDTVFYSEWVEKPLEG